MSDQETYVADLLLEDAMDEIFHGGPSPGLADRILLAAETGSDPLETSTPAEEVAEAPALKLVPFGKAQGEPRGLRSRPWYRWAIDGAVAACVAAVLVLLFVPNTEVEPKPPQVSVELPAGVTATDDAQYTPAALGGGLDGLQVEGGWYVLTDGAPTVINGGHRVDEVSGKVLVKVGEIPSQEELAAQMSWLTTQEIEEKDMSAKQWIKVGALAVCVMAGSAWVNDSFVMAQDNERKEDADRPAAKLAQLEKELAELEAKLERVRGMEDGRDKRQKLARIDNAIKDKKEQIANLKERIRNAKGDDRREGERKDADRRDGERKDSDRKDGERREGERKERDRAAEERREADRKAREDAARKEREEAERKRRAEDEDRARKEREERARKEREDAARNERKRNGRRQ